MLAVGKDLVLTRQVGTARIHQVDAGQAVIGGNRLRAQVFLDRDRVVGAAFDGRIVGDDHAFLAGNPADTGNQAASGNPVVAVQFVARELADFEKRRTRVEQSVDALAHQHLAAAEVLGARLVIASLCDLGDPGAQVLDQHRHRRTVVFELGIARIDPRLDDAHRPAPSSRAMIMRWISLVPS